jgi:hypothetical protein
MLFVVCECISIYSISGKSLDDDDDTRLQHLPEPRTLGPVEPEECEVPKEEEEEPRQFRRKDRRRKHKKSKRRKTEEEEEFRRARKMAKKREESNDVAGKNVAPMRRKGSRNPGVMQELSPMSLYSRPPPPHTEEQRDNETGTGSSNSGNREQASDGTSNNSSNNNSSAEGNANNGTAGTPSSDGGGDCSGNLGGGSKQGSDNSGDAGQHQQPQQMDFDHYDYPDSPTQKWFADNGDLSPLTVLDNINLKTEFPYAGAAPDVEKPPDNNNIVQQQHTEINAVNEVTQMAPVSQVSTVAAAASAGSAIPMDVAAAENLCGALQFNASVPVPDSSVLLDIGTDTFSQSLYDDLINLSDFPSMGNNNNIHSSNALALAVSALAATSGQDCIGGGMTHTPPINTVQLQPVLTMPPATTTTTMVVLQPKPVTLEKIGQPTLLPQQQLQQHQQPYINLTELMRIKAEQSMNTITMFPKEMQHNPGMNPIKDLMEPLPASALKGLIKVEPTMSTPLSGLTHVYTPNLVKVELPEHPPLAQTPLPPQSVLTLELAGNHTQSSHPGEVFSPLDSMGSAASPGSPSGSYMAPQSPSAGGGKMKGSPVRKKSTSSSEEDDISNIPSLKMRIQVISQRVSISFVN